ncbi:ABC transporter substrate-binding protein [Pseudonocardia petroleophila]|uniref:ABC transporter substrate-binding protein n=1 Tax=Pseudonocardia petroleophila TaxID=37331 RepID=A0A7G7MLE8_9PSEU|nr:ABC transporter substrate-binding protein [Pseudonocardia petroleophila]QNG53609.1 ABC transporter substrate-binding protein [Pseudonocardia petroleophila]
MRRRSTALGAMTAIAALVLTACGGGGGGGGGTAGTALEGTGPITLVQGKDVSGFVQGILDEWNAAHPDETVTLIELPESADAQRQQMIQNAQAQSNAFDVLVVDNVWTAEFAANRYIVELPEDQFPVDDMLPPVIDSARYLDKLYAVPNSSDGGMLYYRTDLLEAAGITAPPTTWAELGEQCAAIQATPQGAGVACYAGQFEKYEGLTVNFAEVVNGAGGVITEDDGTPNVNTPEARAGLDFLVNGFASGEIPAEAITYKEEEGRRAFMEGRLIFQRQWPYQYSLANATDGSSSVAGNFAVAPLPGLDGPGVSSLGGHALGISTFSQNKATALEFIKFYTTLENSQKYLELASQAPIYTSIYDDPALQTEFPYLPVLKESILTAVPRPKVVRYGDATLAIQDAAYGALTGEMTSEEALTQLQTQLEALTTN